jgi:transcriptional regulator with XRE-family HTH domain
MNMLAQKIKRARMLSGKTQEQVCIALNWSQSKYSRFETGEREPAIGELRRLAECFGISFEDLIGNTPLILHVGSADHDGPLTHPRTSRDEMAELLKQHNERVLEFNRLLARQMDLIERLVRIERNGLH